MTKRQALLLAIAVFVVGGLLAATVIKPAPNSRMMQSNTATTTVADQKTIPKASKQTLTQSTATPSSPTAAASDTPAPAPVTSPTETAPSKKPKDCDLDINAERNEYKRKIRQQRDLLRDRLDYLIVGSSIAVDYIHSYNQATSALFQQYTQNAQAHACTFPEPKPETLPDSYMR